MSSIAKGVGVPGLNTRGIALTALVVFLIFGLFFIPEIIDFQLGRGATKRAATPIVAGAKSSTQSAFDKVMGYFQGSKRKSSADSSQMALDAGQSAGTEIKTKIATENLQVPAEHEKLMNSLGQELTWTSLKDKATRTALTKAAEDAANLGKSLQIRFPQSAEALFGFVSGIRYLQGGAQKTMDAEGAFKFIQNLDMRVTNAMLQEGVPSADYASWTTISLGPVFESSQAMRLRAARAKPFDPQLKILALRVYQPGDSHYVWQENGPTAIHLVGSVVGRDVRRIEVYRDFQRLRDRAPRAPNRDGVRFFSIHGENARGVYTFKIVHKNGQTFLKSYAFYQRARAFPWIPRKKGLFAIPIQDADPALDRYFLLAQGHSGIGDSSGGSRFTWGAGSGLSKF